MFQSEIASIFIFDPANRNILDTCLIHHFVSVECLCTSSILAKYRKVLKRYYKF